MSAVILADRSEKAREAVAAFLADIPDGRAPRRGPSPGTPQYDAMWVARQLATVPAPWRGRVEKRYRETLRSAGLFEANTWLRRRAEAMRQAMPCGLAADAGEEDIRRAAAETALGLYELAQAYPIKTLDAVREVVAEALRMRGVDMPAAGSVQGELARVFDADWWRRRLRAAHGRAVELQAIDLGYVHKRAGCYASDVAVERRRQQRARNAAILESVEAENSAGDVFLLSELAAAGTANPAIRRTELMTRIAGTERVAIDLGHAACFVTLTAPSRLHAVLSDTCERNPKYDGSSPREAQDWLCKAWARIRAALARKGLRLYGFRISEAHHDGCPHWHLLLWAPLWIKGGRLTWPRIKAIFRRYALADWPPMPTVKALREQGYSIKAARAERERILRERRRAERADKARRKHACDFEDIDPAKGSAVGYVAKYVSKNIDGHALDDDRNGNDGGKGAERVEAWASTWRIRQFQQIGAAPVGVWRELRRMARAAGKAESPVVASAMAAADAGDWAQYVKTMGGPTVERRNLPLRAAYTEAGYRWEPAAGDGAGFMPAENCYGEPAAPAVYGVRVAWSGDVAVSRTTRWTTRRATQGTRDAAERRAVLRGGVSGREHRAPWTRVNNCTEVKGGEKARGGGGGSGSGAGRARFDAAPQSGDGRARIPRGGGGNRGDCGGAAGAGG